MQVGDLVRVDPHDPKQQLPRQPQGQRGVGAQQCLHSAGNGHLKHLKRGDKGPIS